MIIKKNKSPNAQNEQSVKTTGSQSSSNYGDDLDFENPTMKERDERRRGNRRRGYRRIDDRKLVSRAQEEAITIKETAAKEGFQKGIEMANTEITKIKASLQGLVNSKQAVYEEISKDILDIAVEIARKIINKEIQEDKTILIGMVKNALRECGKNESKVTIKVSVQDIDFVKSFVPEILSETQVDGKIHVISDMNIKENNVIIETTNGVIDVSFETQLAVLKEMFKAM